MHQPGDIGIAQELRTFHVAVTLRCDLPISHTNPGETEILDA